MFDLNKYPWIKVICRNDDRAIPALEAWAKKYGPEGMDQLFETIERIIEEKSLLGEEGAECRLDSDNELNFATMERLACSQDVEYRAIRQIFLLGLGSSGTVQTVYFHFHL